MKLKNRHLKKFCCSKIALALPITFLILFVSTMGIVAFTYYFSVERINVQGTTLKVSTAKQNLLSLDDAIVSTLWQPGSQATYEVADSGGRLNILPQNNTLTLSISALSEINEVIFNSSVGKITYELPYQNSPDTGLYLKGDERAITNQSGSSMSQLCIQNGLEHPEVQLRYRPSVTYTVAGEEAGRAVNNIRVYVANLNSSDSISLHGKLPLQMVCQTTQLTTLNYQVTSGIDVLTVSAILDGKAGSVTVPVSTTDGGALVHLELVICNVSVERWIR